MIPKYHNPKIIDIYYSSVLSGFITPIFLSWTLPDSDEGIKGTQQTFFDMKEMKIIFQCFRISECRSGLITCFQNFRSLAHSTLQGQSVLLCTKWKALHHFHSNRSENFIKNGVSINYLVPSILTYHLFLFQRTNWFMTEL
jgi:hypothetical protein